jgi:type VI secretion system protein ImpL
MRPPPRAAEAAPRRRGVPPWLRTLLTAASVAAGAALVWFIGPLVAIAGHVPLAGEPARWAAIAALITLALLRALWRRAAAARRNRKLIDGLVGDARRAAAPGDKEVAVVAQRFEKAVAVLRSERIGQGKRHWWQALSGRPYIYQLPWYIIIGAPGAGKTTALVNSGLDFPLATELGRTAVRGIGGTRNCDWWFTSQAVLIDTAGRYTTHDSHREADRTAWFGFLDLLARYRPRRPINGVLLTLSASDLLNATPEQRAVHGATLRARIEELHERLGIAFPVYVLVTKCDLLAGFMDFFGDFDKDERAQVWGMTFPWQADTVRDGPQVLLAQEFAALEKRLNDCLLAQLEGEADRERRAAMQAFPQQWRVLRQTLFDFLQSLLGELRAELRPSMRGVYFTSATQEGTPIDRALGGMARALGLPAQVLQPARPSGKTFFVTRALRDVVFAEAGLAGANLRWQRRRRGLEWGLVGACAAAVAGVAVLSWRTYAHTQQQVETVSARLPDLEREVATAKAAPVTDLVALLPALDTLAALQAGGADSGAAPRPVALLPVLDRSEMLDAAAGDSYARALREAFQPRIAARLEARLRAGEREHVALIYDTLKAYLMLFGGKHFDRDALRAYLLADWDATLPSGTSAMQRAGLRRHLDRLLAGGEVGAPSAADPALVARTRALVRSVPLAQRAYERLKQVDPGAEAVAISLPADAERLFKRAGGQPVAAGVPALYSRAFQQSLPGRTQEVLRQFAREQAWVLGVDAGATDTAAARTLADDVRALYMADYAARWQAFVGGLELAPVASLGAGADLAAALARADSTLLALLRAVVRETSAVLADDRSGAGWDALRGYVAGQPAPIEAMQSLLGRLATHLRAVDEAARRQTLPPAGSVLREFAAAVRDAPAPLRAWLTPLAAQSASLALAATREPLSRQVAAEIAPACNRIVAGRYPLQRNATQELSRAEFAQAFGAGGVFDAFVQRQLLPYVDTTAAAWTLRGAGSDSAEALQPFQRAQGIRQALFRDGGATLGVRLELRPLEFDPGIGEFMLDVDGQVLRFRAGMKQAQALQWPGPAAGDNGRVALQVSTGGGAPGATFAFQGPWALFRLLDRVRVEPGAAPERPVLVFDVEGRKARFEVRSSAGADPLARALLEQFKCPTRL